jgi:NDP-sugar pyrophosphorylase family protein
MASVLGRPFLSYLLDQLSSAGVKHVVLCTGYMGEYINNLMGYFYGDITLKYSLEPFPLGTGGALKFALPEIKSQTFLVMNGDSFCNIDLRDFYLWHVNMKSRASLTVTKVDDTGRYGRVFINEHEKIEKFLEKDGMNIPGWINAGIYLLNYDVINSIPDNTNISLEKEIFPHCINDGLYAYKKESLFIDMGTPEAYSKIESFFNNIN